MKLRGITLELKRSEVENHPASDFVMRAMMRDWLTMFDAIRRHLPALLTQSFRAWDENPIYLEIYERAKNGESATSIARDIGYSLANVTKIIRGMRALEKEGCE
jgi:hypothetical protein